MKTEYEIWQDELNQRKPKLLEHAADTVLTYFWVLIILGLFGLILARFI